MEYKLTAKDLRIGNLLYFKGSEYLANVQLINSPNHFDCRDEYGSFCPNGSYEPIPLNDDWLKRTGFIYSENLKIYHIEKYYKSTCEPDDYEGAVYHNVFFFENGESFGFEVSNEWGESGNLMMPKIKYVHQLQNLFYFITGQELTIK